MLGVFLGTDGLIEPRIPRINPGECQSRRTTSHANRNNTAVQLWQEMRSRYGEEVYD